MSPPVSPNLRNRKIWDWERGRFQVFRSNASPLCPHHPIFLLISWDEAGIPSETPGFVSGQELLLQTLAHFSHPSWLLLRDQPIFCSPSKPAPEAIPEFLFHPCSGFCRFKVKRIHSAAVLVIYSLRGFLQQRIWIKLKLPPLFL